MTTHYHTIALSADYAYAEQVLTTIKSICYHNTHIHFYLLNNSFPEEWFTVLNVQLQQINCKITDLKIICEQLQHYPRFPHIHSEAAYYRYFIPELIPDQHVLYLDCDLVVNGKLNSLFDTDLQGNFLGAVHDPIAKTIWHLDQFNSGVMLIDNQAWKAINSTARCLALSDQMAENIKIQGGGDQDILNNLFNNQWLKLNRGYNYQIGVDYVFNNDNYKQYLEDLGDTTPMIVHYCTSAKPWKILKLTRFRNLYWYYYQLSWADIIQHHYSQ